MSIPPDKLSSATAEMPEAGDRTSLRTVIESGTVEGLPLGPTAPKRSAEAPERSAALPQATTGRAPLSSRRAAFDLPKGSAKAPVRTAGIARPERPKPVPISEAGVRRGRQLHDALLGTDKPDAAGPFDSAVPVLESLTVAEAEEALVALLQSAPNREMSLVYQNGKLVKACVGITKTDDAPTAQAPLPKDFKLVDTVVTHTHPDGSPLSRGDVMLAVKNNVLEIRAAGPHGAFALRRKGDDWGLPHEKVFDHYSKLGPQAWDKGAPAEAGDLRPDQAKPGKKQGATFLEDAFMGEHYACKTMQETYGCEYIHPADETLLALRIDLYEERKAQRGDDRAGTKGDLKTVKMAGGSTTV